MYLPLAPFNLRHLPNQFCVHLLSVHWIIGDLYDYGLIILGGIFFNRLVFFKYKYLLIFGCPCLHCCTGAFSSCRGGLLFTVVHGLFAVLASLVAEHRLLSEQAPAAEPCGLSCVCGMWNLPAPGFEPMSPALADGFLSTVPSGKSHTGNYFDSCPEKAVVSKDRVLGSYRYQQLLFCYEHMWI